MDRSKERVQQQGGGDRWATTTLPGRSEWASARDQAGVQDDNSWKQVRQTCRDCPVSVKAWLPFQYIIVIMGECHS